MIPLLQISSHPPSCSAPNKSSTANCWRDECENGINQNKMRDQQSITGGSLINESQKAASTAWEVDETQAKAKTTGKLQFSLEKTKTIFCIYLLPLTLGCQSISQAISYILVSVVEKPIQTLKQLSLWANRGNRNREERKGVRVLTTVLVKDASMKKQPNLYAVIFINLVIGIFGNLWPI